MPGKKTAYDLASDGDYEELNTAVYTGTTFADINSARHNGWTPLHFAALNASGNRHTDKWVQTLSALLKLGADPSLKETDELEEDGTIRFLGRTPLEILLDNLPTTHPCIQVFYRHQESIEAAAEAKRQRALEAARAAEEEAAKEAEETTEATARPRRTALQKAKDTAHSVRDFIQDPAGVNAMFDVGSRF